MTGCGTIDQAPLVYVSTVKVGANVATGTTATPGAQIMLGVDATDAAYVPVAVGRSCSAANLQTCQQLPITQLRANNNFAPGKAFEAAREALTNLMGASGALRDLKLPLDARRAELEEARGNESRAGTLRAALEALPAAPVPLADGSTPADGNAGARASLGQQIAQLGDTKKAVSDRQAQFDAARTAYERQAALVDQAQLDLNRALGTDPGSAVGRNDAYSVFGSFNSSTTAEVGDAKPKAGLGLGKTFSTGIAAQLLTEGLGDAAPIEAAGRCIDRAVAAAKEVTAGADRDTFLKLAMAACDMHAAHVPR